MVSTTSLMVQPQALRTAFSSSRGISSQSKRRCGPTSPLSGVGTAREPSASRSTIARARIESSSRTSSTCAAKLRKSWIARSGAAMRRRSASRKRSAPLGIGRGMNCGRSPISGFSGEADSSTWARSTPAEPSIMQWWILVMSAKLSPSSRPSTTHVSHSGRLRSSCCDMMRAESFLS
jgi:hypothetical protein